MATTWEQKQILRDVVDGLNAAIEEAELEPADVDPIKFNKLLYLAVDEWDLPVTYWWYKYGADFTFHGFNESQLEPKALDGLPSPEQPRVGPDDLGVNEGYPSPEKYKRFYLEEVEDLERLFADDTKEYLQDFYRNYAPDHLADLYAACAVFQKTLDSIGRADDPGAATVENIETVLDELRTLNREVHLTPLLNDVRKRYKEYTDLLKNVLVTVDEKNGDFNSSEEAFTDTIRFFYDQAWQMIAFKIASENSYGSDAYDRKQTANGRLQRLLDNWEEDFAKLERKCEQADLIAEALLKFDPPLVREVDHEAHRKLTNNTYDEWEGASKEAGRDL